MSLLGWRDAGKPTEIQEVPRNRDAVEAIQAQKGGEREADIERAEIPLVVEGAVELRLERPVPRVLGLDPRGNQIPVVYRVVEDLGVPESHVRVPDARPQVVGDLHPLVVLQILGSAIAQLFGEQRIPGVPTLLDSLGEPLGDGLPQSLQLGCRHLGDPSCLARV